MEENIVAEVTETTVSTVMETEEIPAEETAADTVPEIFVTAETESIVSDETLSETEPPADQTMTNEEIISSIIAEAMSENGIETTVMEEIRTETFTEYVTEFPAVTEQTTTVSAETETVPTATETVPITETAAELPAVTVPSGQENELPYFALLPIAAAGIAAGVLKMKSKKSRKNISEEDTPLSARERDAVRLSANKPDKKKKEKTRRDHSEKKRKNVSKSVLSTLPYKKVLSDDIFFLGKKMYSKAYTFDDINFNLADEEQQYMYLERYIEFLGILDDSVDCQICCWNSRVNMEKFRNDTLLKQKADELFDYRHEFNTKVLEANILKGQNAVQKHMYITLTIKAPDEETAARRFKTLDITAINTFNRIGNTGLRALTAQERIEMLKDYYIGHDDMPVPHLTEEDYAKGREKLFCAPDYFDFKKDYFMFNDTYAKSSVYP